MRAARFHATQDIRIEDIPAPELKRGHVAIDVGWCGICGSDLHEYLEGPIIIPPAGQPHPISGEEAPITMGHEFSGTVTAVADDVDDLTPGQKVVIEPYIIGDDVPTDDPEVDYQLSPNMNFIGLGGRGGGFSEKVVVARRWVHPIADHVGLDEAALIEPLAVGYHAYRKSRARAGDVALIGGAGPIGLLTAAVLKAEGVDVYISEISEGRKAKARETGVADEVFDPREVDVVEEVSRLTGGKGADVAFECTSVGQVLNTLIAAVKPAGVVVNVSIWGHKPEVDLQNLVLREVEIIGSAAYAHDHPTVISMVEDGKIDLAPFITGRIGLDDLVDKGFDQLINNNDEHVKILVSPTL
ncbi:2,3-butanediol dehydrogenase [Nesterenkonia alba]|uniref:2,3-butanediol dehydrogenase n=1 Tax=Nesterenkonia alba TaxID=515814 RepID=UPI0003B79840|nr:2,3-butanediol dehydrogenase [Nesterenkonia alba]